MIVADRPLLLNLNLIKILFLGKIGFTLSAHSITVTVRSSLKYSSMPSAVNSWGEWRR